MISGYMSETELPHADWFWSDINNDVAYENPKDFWDEVGEIYDINGDATIHEFRPLIELPTLYGVTIYDEMLDENVTRYFADREDAVLFGEENG